MYLKSSLPICILKLKPEIETESWAAFHTGPAAIRGQVYGGSFEGGALCFRAGEIRNPKLKLEIETD